MLNVQKYKVFPRDIDTLFIIKETEEYLGLKNKEIDEMSNTELIDYIDEITLVLLNQMKR